MPYKTTADLLENQNLFGTQPQSIRPNTITENLSDFFLGNRKERGGFNSWGFQGATPPQGTPSAPNAQGVADSMRINNINTATQRIKSSASNYPANSSLNKAGGLESFNPYPTSSTNTQPNLAKKDEGVFNPETYKAWANADLEKAKNNSAAELQHNLNVLDQYTPKANDEANRAYGMQLDNNNRALGNELATKFPYQKYETETGAARESMSDTLRTMPSFLNRNTAVKPQQYVSF